MLSALSIAAYAQGGITINGSVNNVDDGTVIEFFLIEGQTGRRIASDTISDHRFTLSIPVDRDDMFDDDVHGLIHGVGAGISPIPLPIYLEPGITINITGNDNNIYTWQVESPVKEQNSQSAFINDSKELWNEYQQLAKELQNARSQLRSIPDEDAAGKAAANAKTDSLDRLQQQINISIDANDIKRLQHAEIDNAWMKVMRDMAVHCKYIENYPYIDQAKKLYNRIPDEWKSTPAGEYITNTLFPPVVINEGEPMADGHIFKDLDGKEHHLHEFIGKHMLIEFWSFACGGCVFSMPALLEMAKNYKDNLTIVMINVDSEKNWREAVKSHQLEGDNIVNLRDSHSTNGLMPVYGFEGIPSYVLVSPDGTILHKWFGYSDFAPHLTPYLGEPKQ